MARAFDYRERANSILLQLDAKWLASIFELLQNERALSIGSVKA